MMAGLDICFDRKTFLEQICRACSRYYSCDDDGSMEKMELLRIFNDAQLELNRPQMLGPDIKEDDDESSSAMTAVPSEKIKEIFPEIMLWNLNIKPNDGLPQQICADCLERFRGVKSFREECLDTQKILESYFKDFSLLENSKSPKTESIKSEPGVSPTPSSFNPEDLVEEVPESPEQRQLSPMTSPKLQQSPVYAESSMGTPPPIFEEIKTEPIDVQTMESIKTEAELHLELKLKEEIKEEDAELALKAINTQSLQHYTSSNEESSTSTTDDDDDDEPDNVLSSSSSSIPEFKPAFNSNIDPRYDSRKPLQCKICFNIFPKRSLLKEHQLRSHPEEKPYACNMCASTFKSNFMLSQHKLKHNRPDSIRCELCSKYFRSQLHLQRHTKNFHLTSTYTCHICHEQFEKYTQIRFQYHVRQHGEKRFHCQFCAKSFHQKIHLNNHERTHTKEQPFCCDICGKSYRQQTACQEHRLTHSDPTPFKCKICEKGFTQRSSLRLHYRIHAGHKPFTCELCGQKFAQKVHLELHQLTHNEAPHSYQCEICNKQFLALNQLTAHIEIHTTNREDDMDSMQLMQRQHSCVYCGKTFALAATLVAHIKTHSQTFQTYKCQYCDKCFKNLQAQQLHEQKHTEDKKFKCSFCEQTFLYRTSLGQHMVTHLGTQSTHADDGAINFTFNASI